MQDMTNTAKVQERLEACRKRIQDIDDSWGGWTCAYSSIERLEECLDTFAPAPVYGFKLPARITIRGARTHVRADPNLPPDWEGRTRWTWFIDDELIQHTSGPEARLNTAGLFLGEHRLRVVAELEEAGVIGGTKLEELPSREPLPGPRLAEIEGVGPSLAAKFADAQVVTTGDLLAVAATPSKRADLAHRAGLPVEKVLEVTHHADLFRIEGVAGQYAELLRAANVHTVRQLARRNPERLLQALEAVKGSRVKRLPTQEQVADWIRQAAALPTAVLFED